jgi:RimJ/RimL family protein N-acetyltransferase
MSDASVKVIRCEHFDLVLMTAPFIEALLAGDDDAAQRELDVRFPIEAWAKDDGYVLRMRLDQMRTNPESAHWLLRAIVSPDRRMLGHAGFHGPPDERGFVELGYTIFAPFRRQGCASAAATCMMRWAEETQGVHNFRVSVGETNTPSLAMAAKLGFTRTSEQMDEIDGLEYVFERVGAP